MVNKTNFHSEHTTPNPNSTMESDWDIIAEIWNTIHEGNLSETISFVHIKGHADKEKKYEELSLLQQLNVDADHLAGAYINMHWQERQFFIFLFFIRMTFNMNKGDMI